MSGGAATAGTGRGSAPGAEPGRWRRHRVTIAFLAPAAILLGVWIVYPTIYTIVRSFFDREGSDFVGLDNYQELFSQDTLTTAIKNNVLWLAIVPALVTAIGLVFAVLLERVRWSVAFKTVVFMPMAISLFAAGVIWRVMDEKDPEHRRRQRLDRRGRRRRRSAGRAVPRAALDRRPHRQPEQRAHARAARRSRRRRAARPHRDPAEGGSRRRGAGSGAAGRGGRDHRRRVARLQARGRQARRRRAGELGLPGVTVELHDPGGDNVAKTETRDDGSFAFEEVEAADRIGSRSGRRRSRSRSRAWRGSARA